MPPAARWRCSNGVLIQEGAAGLKDQSALPIADSDSFQKPRAISSLLTGGYSGPSVGYGWASF